MKKIISALILVLCFGITSGVWAQKLKGIWKYKTEGNSSTVVYKIFTKDGRYMNIRSVDNGKTFNMKQYGVREDVMPGLYIEHLGATKAGDRSQADIMMSYKKEKNRLIITFRLGNSVYNEVWEQLKEVPSL